MRSLTLPALLTKGDTVAITAASMPCTHSKLEIGIEKIQDMGLKVQVMDSCYAAHNYLAGLDALRLHDLHAAFADKNIKGIFMARGGYGAARLLPHLNYELIRQNPKIFVGFSDVTALHIALNQFGNLATYHGPMPASCFASEELHPLTLSSFTGAVFLNKFGRFSAGLQTLCPGHASGILTGGNLSVIASTLGTPYEIKTRGRILFLEEVQEPPYRVDRLLLQLKLAGKLSDAAGIAFGDFSPESLDTLGTAINELILPEKKPTIWGMPSGHTSPNFTIPLGMIASITAPPAHLKLSPILDVALCHNY